jgi:hypothetical protein
LFDRRWLLSGVALGAATLPLYAAPATTVNAFIEASQYALVGDGKTVNDAQFAAAFAALTTQGGGVLRLGVGTYLFSKTLVIPAGSVIEGGGMGVSILKCTADITGVTFPSQHSRCGLRALSLEGTGQRGTGLQIGDHEFTGNHHVRDVIIRGWATGTRLAGALWTTFDNTVFDQNGRGLDFNAGWSSGYSTTVAFRQCVFSANDYGGVTATYTPITSSCISWLGCTIERNCHADPTKYPQMAFTSGSYGILGFIIDACYFEAGTNPPPDAIRANGLHCGRISNCNFYDSTYAICDTAGGDAATRIAIFGNGFVGSIKQNLHFEHDSEIVAFCNAYGKASNTLTGPGSGSIFGAPQHAAQTTREGEWTPTLVGSIHPGSHSYDRCGGTFSRIGNQVTIHAQLRLQQLDRSMSGNLQISGLPLRSAGSAELPAVVSIAASGVRHAPGYSAFHGLIAPRGASIEIVESGSGVPCVKVPSTSIAADMELSISATYTAHPDDTREIITPPFPA